MSRFENLEFDAKVREPAKPGSKGTPVRDAAFFIAEGDKAFLAGGFELALRDYSRALEHNSAVFEGWFGQVRMLIELSEYEEAILWSGKALELFPENPDLLAARAVASLRSGEIEKALAYCDNALSRKGVTPYVWIARAEALLMRRSNAAEHCLSNALVMASNSSAMTHLEIGRMLRQNGRSPAALEHLRKAVVGLPASALAWLELGRCQAALGFAEAEVALNQSLALRPHWTEARTARDRFRSRGFLARLKAVFRRRR